MINWPFNQVLLQFCWRKSWKLTMRATERLPWLVTFPLCLWCPFPVWEAGCLFLVNWEKGDCGRGEGKGEPAWEAHSYQFSLGAECTWKSKAWHLILLKTAYELIHPLEILCIPPALNIPPSLKSTGLAWKYQFSLKWLYSNPDVPWVLSIWESRPDPTFGTMGFFRKDRSHDLYWFHSFSFWPRH